MANSRAEFRELCATLLNAADSIEEDLIRESLDGLILKDLDEARGFFEEALQRTMRYLSPTVGQRNGRPFRLKLEILASGSKPKIIAGISYLPLVGDDQRVLAEHLGEEFIGLIGMRKLDWLFSGLAVNGTAIEG